MRLTDVRVENLKLILEKMCRVKAGTHLLVFADDYARSMTLAQDLMELANSMGAEAVLAVFKRRTHLAEEPPPSVAAAMKSAEVIIGVTEGPEIAHSNARKEATEAGIRRCVFVDPIDGEDHLQNPITLGDLDLIRDRSARLCEIESQGKRVRLTTPHGTDITFSIEGRSAISLSPLAESPLVVAPFYAETAIAPVEGTTEGVIVIDSFVQGWESVLRRPIRYEVRKGRARVETVSSDIPEDAERFKKTLLMDGMANNCAAELGIGTSHIIPGYSIGHVTDKARIGHVHIAIGRNYDLGGTSDSIIHVDGDMTLPTLTIDGVTLLENGELRI
jgi:leucyl aminopeptidase (aminopeptidase T)